nr:ribonuclease H-like domain-containing protein [Tanacetum cinerariifolium]
MDVKSTFLYGTTEEEVYVSQALGFVDPEFPNRVYKVEKVLYGLHQAPRACVKSASTPMETHKPLSKDAAGTNTKIHMVNESAIRVVKDPFYYSKTKHIEIRHHFVVDSYEKRLIEMVKIHIDYNVVDLLTKAFDVTRMACKNGHVMKMGLKLKGYLINDGYADLVQHAACLIDKKELAIPGKTATGKELLNPLMAGSLPKTTLPTQLIVDFLNANQIKYALIVSPTIYTTCIKQIWTTLKIKTVNDDVQLQALIDGKKVVITKASIRHDLKLNDAEGTACLPNAVIFKELARMRYEKPSGKLTFYKAFFSPQWKFFIHIILQCLSAKTTSWNKFSSTTASAIICLANSQKFNFSKYILDNLKKNLEAGVPFYMFPRKHKPRRKDMKKRKETKVSPTKLHIEDHIHIPSNDSLPSGEDSMPLKELMRRKIADINADAEVNLENVYNLDMVHEETVLSMQDVTDADVKEVVEEIVEVITTAKIIVDEVSTVGGELNAASEEPISAAPTNITTAQPSEATKTTVDITTAPKAKGIVFHDMEE